MRPRWAHLCHAGATVERPINSAPAVCLILLGVFNWLTACSGLLGSSRFMCCLDIFLVLDAVNVILTLTLVAELFMNFDGLVASVGEAQAPIARRAGPGERRGRPVLHGCLQVYGGMSCVIQGSTPTGGRLLAVAAAPSRSTAAPHPSPPSSSATHRVPHRSIPHGPLRRRPRALKPARRPVAAAPVPGGTDRRPGGGPAGELLSDLNECTHPV